MSLGSAGSVEDLGLENMAGPSAKAKDWHTGNFFMNLGLTVVLRFILSTLLTTCPIPGGPYTPFLVVGAALGRLWAETLVYLFPAWGANVEPNAYSLVAAAALTAGATHQRFSSAVIVLELAGMTMMFPLLICVAISTYVANSLFIPLADSIIRMRGWTSYNDLKAEYQNIAISDLMITDPEVLTEKSTLEEITSTLFFMSAPELKSNSLCQIS
jgi:H+/Cl- antiporter ClcA